MPLKQHTSHEYWNFPNRYRTNLSPISIRAALLSFVLKKVGFSLHYFQDLTEGSRARVMCMGLIRSLSNLDRINSSIIVKKNHQFVSSLIDFIISENKRRIGTSIDVVTFFKKNHQFASVKFIFLRFWTPLTMPASVFFIF